MGVEEQKLGRIKSVGICKNLIIENDAEKVMSCGELRCVRSRSTDRERERERESRERLVCVGLHSASLEELVHELQHVVLAHSRVRLAAEELELARFDRLELRVPVLLARLLRSHRHTRTTINHIITKVALLVRPSEYFCVQ